MIRNGVQTLKGYLFGSYQRRRYCPYLDNQSDQVVVLIKSVINRSTSPLNHANTARLYLPSAKFSPVKHLPRYFLCHFPYWVLLPKTLQSLAENTQEDEIKLLNLIQPDIIYDSDSTNIRICRGPRSKLHAMVDVRNNPSYMAVDKELNGMIKKTEEILKWTRRKMLALWFMTDAESRCILSSQASNNAADWKREEASYVSASCYWK